MANGITIKNEEDKKVFSITVTNTDGSMEQKKFTTSSKLTGFDYNDEGKLFSATFEE